MKFELHVFLHSEETAWLTELGQINEKLDKLLKGQTKIMSDLTNITEQVTETLDVEQSAIVLLGDLATQIAELKNDPVALQALADSLAAKKADLAAAIVANTPPPPPAPPAAGDGAATA